MLNRSMLTAPVLAVLLAVCVPSPAMAGQRSFVASYGNDANICSLPSPCRSFDVAIAKTAADGEVVALDSAGYGATTISKPVSIVAPPGVYAGVSVFAGGPTGGTGLVVNPGAGNVALRGLTINSQGGTVGIAYQSGDALYVDNVVVSNFPGAGLSADVGANGLLQVTGSTFRDNGIGAQLNATAGTLKFDIDRTLFARNPLGVGLYDSTVGTIHGSKFSGGTTGIMAAPATGTKSSRFEVRDCVIADNYNNGVTIDSTVAPVQASIVSSLVAGNGLAGIDVVGAGNSVYVSDSTLTRNYGWGLSLRASGTAASGLDNRVINNASSPFTSSVPKL